ncbi:hypothetical protein ALC53_03034 [Atta colombica]|uniref:Uncharacterized protein n=1 Tax=Atta colombica TaxID=520822 RepID=A0A195BRH0_9HYME|nr:hypothetical protein ALC53_03034 [Atta colombica]
MVYMGLAGQYFSELDPNFNGPPRAVDPAVRARKLVGMERRDVILTAVFGTVGALAILVGLALAMWLYLRARKSKQRDDDLEDQNDNGDASSQQQSTKKNGFLNLKTPLISTKALGHKLLFLLSKNIRMLCCRVMAFRRIGSTIAHKSKSSYLRLSYVLVLQVNETLWKKIVLIIFVVNCLPLILWSRFLSQAARWRQRIESSSPEDRRVATPSLGVDGGETDARRKASVSDATSLRSDRSDLTRAPPSYACQAQQDARSSDSSRARSTVICVAYPAGSCLRYGRTSDRRVIARKYDARGPYDGNWCDAAMRRRENTMPMRNAIDAFNRNIMRNRKRGFAASRLVPELAQTSLWPASYEVGGEVYMQIWGGRYNRRYAVKKGREKATLQIFTAVVTKVTHGGVLEEVAFLPLFHVSLSLSLFLSIYLSIYLSSYLALSFAFNNFPIVARSYLIRSIVTFYPHILVYAQNRCTIRFSKKTDLREVSYFIRSCEWMLVIEAFTGAIGLVSGSKVKYSLCVNHQRRCKQYCKTTLVIQTKCKFENFVVCDVMVLKDIPLSANNFGISIGIYLFSVPFCDDRSNFCSFAKHRNVSRNTGQENWQIRAICTLS